MTDWNNAAAAVQAWNTVGAAASMNTGEHSGPESYPSGEETAEDKNARMLRSEQFRTSGERFNRNMGQLNKAWDAQDAPYDRAPTARRQENIRSVMNVTRGAFGTTPHVGF